MTGWQRRHGQGSGGPDPTEQTGNFDWCLDRERVYNVGIQSKLKLQMIF